MAQKLLLLSVIIATFAIPTVLERRTDGKTEFGHLLKTLLLFTAAYTAALLFVYPRLS